MSEHITHIAVYEDTVRIFRQQKLFNQAFNIALDNQYDSGLFCSGTRGNHLYAIPILDKMRHQVAQNITLSQTDEMKVAGAIGWITHRAADLMVKPMFKAVEAENSRKYNAQANSIYHDVASFKNVYQSGHVGALSAYENITPALMEHGLASMPASAAINTAALEARLSFYWVNQFIGLHQATTSPLDEFTDEVLEPIFKHAQQFTEVWNDYIEAFNTR
ncbi:MAG: hypothetical protein HC896_05295 [Bacteroidales bacterium]|nr:hypothetical protein [Bacteroidales bacterium]